MNIYKILCAKIQLKDIFCCNNIYKHLLLKRSMAIKGGGNIPVLHACGQSIPEAWENSVVELWNKGLYWHRPGPKDKGNLTLDSTMTIEITNPGSDLVMHKYMTCGPEDLFEYQMELLGAKDSWVNLEQNSTEWPYHYHERLSMYPGTKGLINQIGAVIKGLSEEPWKRRNNIITWVPERDLESADPPCLQRIWAMMIPDESPEGVSKLNFNYNFRSRNVMIAAPMNMVGLWTLQSYIRNRVIEKTGLKIQNGRIVDFIDSYHVSAANQNILKGFIDRLERSKSEGETTIDRCLDKKIVFDYINKSAIEEKIIEQTKKIFERRRRTSEDFDKEVKKVRQISQEVSKINKRAYEGQWDDCL